MIRRTLLVTVVAAAVLSGLAVFDPDDRGAAPAPVTTPAGSDYYMLDARATQYGADGRLRYRVHAAESLHFPNDSVRLRDLRVHYAAGSGDVWRLAARRGRVPPDSRDILLTGDVELIRNPGSPTALVVETSRVWVRTDPGLAETEAPVRAHSPGRRAKAEGMTVIFERDMLTLHRDVRVTYIP